MKCGYRSFAMAAAIALTLPIGPAMAQQGVEELAKQDQNPLARFIRVQIEDNAQFGFGPDNQLLNVLRIQPIVPLGLNPGWSLIVRPVVPLVHQPWPASADGLSDILVQTLLSPTRSGRFIWGVGPVFSVPSATDDIIGTGKWSVGPAAIGVFKSGPWVIGAIANNLWSFAGDADRGEVNALGVRPLINYNLPRGWYLTSSPLIAANWQADAGNRWLVPLGGGVGKVFGIATQRISIVLEGFYHVVAPQFGPDWQLRFQLTFLFPR
jgi:hypothetical protein